MIFPKDKEFIMVYWTSWSEFLAHSKDNKGQSAALEICLSQTKQFFHFNLHGKFVVN